MKKPVETGRGTGIPTNHDYSHRIRSALKAEWGGFGNPPGEIARATGAGIGTVRKWLKGENGPSGEHLLKLVALSDEVWVAVLELSGRASNGADERERIRRAVAALKGIA